MKKILSTIALFVTISAYADPQEVLTGIDELRIVPSEFIVGNKTSAYAIRDNKIIIYDDNFKQKSVINPIVQTPIQGNCKAQATVKITGVKAQYSSNNGHYSYWDSDAMTNKELQATSLTDMVKKLSAQNSSYTYVPFTDINGLPACYGYYTEYGPSYNGYYNFYMYDTYMTAYPRQYYTLEGGYVCNRNTEYTVDFDASTAVWKEMPGTRNLYEYISEPIDGFSLIDESMESNYFGLTQTLFNDDENWEYVTAEYGDPVVSVLSTYYNSIKDNEDGTVTLTTDAIIQSEIKALLVKNDKGNTIMTLPAGDINSVIKYNNKYYLDINKSTSSSKSSKRTHNLFILDKKATSNPSKGIRGDVNGDGKVTMSDANEVVNLFLGK